MRMHAMLSRGGAAAPRKLTSAEHMSSRMDTGDTITVVRRPIAVDAILLQGEQGAPNECPLWIGFLLYSAV